MAFDFDNVFCKISSFFTTKKGKKLKFFCLLGIIAAIFVSQLFFNYMTPITLDDYNDSLLWDTGEKITSFSQIIPSAMYHYQVWSGRVVASVIDQSYLLMGQTVFDICNSAVFILFLFLIYYHSTGTLKNFKNWLFVGIFFSLWFFVPDFADSFYWLIGSCNYMHCLTIILIYLIPFTYYFENYEKVKSIKKTLSAIFSIPFIFLGALAGDSTENAGVAAVVITVLFIVKAIIEKKKLQPWMFTGLIGTVSGLIFLLASPGQQERASSAGGLGNVLSWIKNAVFITIDVFDYLAIPLLLLAVVLVAVFAANKKLKFDNFTDFFVFFIGSGASVYCMIIPPQFPERAWTVSVVFALIAFGRLLKLIQFSEKPYTYAITAVMALSVICFGTSYINAYLDLKQTKIMVDNRVATIEQAIAAEEATVILDPIYGFTKYNIYSSYGDLSKTSDTWPNTTIAKYYGVEKIINSNSEEGILYANNKQSTAP